MIKKPLPWKEIIKLKTQKKINTQSPRIIKYRVLIHVDDLDNALKVLTDDLRKELHEKLNEWFKEKFG